MGSLGNKGIKMNTNTNTTTTNIKSVKWSIRFSGKQEVITYTNAVQILGEEEAERVRAKASEHNGYGHYWPVEINLNRLGDVPPNKFAPYGRYGNATLVAWMK